MERYESVEVNGEELKVWPPQTDGDGYSISDSGGWLDGIYQHRDAAILGFQLSRSRDGFTRLAALRDHVNRNKNHPRKIGTSDFQGEFEI